MTNEKSKISWPIILLIPIGIYFLWMFAEGIYKIINNNSIDMRVSILEAKVAILLEERNKGEK